MQNPIVFLFEFGGIMKLLFLLLILNITNIAYAEDISIFNGNGDAIAYIDTDDEMTIYLWKEGDAVAYLDEDLVYGFNGKHLAWFDDGIFYIDNGKAVGFIKGSVSMHTNFEPFKGFKKFKSFKGFKEFTPFKPALIQKWSKLPLIILLNSGLN